MTVYTRLTEILDCKIYFTCCDASTHHTRSLASFRDKPDSSLHRPDLPVLTAGPESCRVARIARRGVAVSVYRLDRVSSAGGTDVRCVAPHPVAWLDRRRHG